MFRYVAILLLAFLAGAAPAFAMDLAAARARALELANADRARHGLPPLRPDQTLDAAAQRHAEDMRARGYFGHVTPDGRDVLDRYLAAGGSGAKRVAENLAECSGCELTPSLLRDFEQGWMESPGHRANILGQGLDRFGFGVARTRDGLYAVQTFAGPGASRGAEGPALDEPGLRAAAARAINEERRAAGLPPLQESPVLSNAASEIVSRLPNGLSGLDRIDGRRVLERVMGRNPNWRTVDVVAGECGGCGVAPTAADVDSFLDQWLENARYRTPLMAPASTHIGFALAADGEGRKTAVALLGQR